MLKYIYNVTLNITEYVYVCEIIWKKQEEINFKVPLRYWIRNNKTYFIKKLFGYISEETSLYEHDNKKKSYRAAVFSLRWSSDLRATTKSSYMYVLIVLFGKNIFSMCIYLFIMLLFFPKRLMMSSLNYQLSLGGGAGWQQKIIQRSWSINYFESHNQYFSK